MAQDTNLYSTSNLSTSYSETSGHFTDARTESRTDSINTFGMHTARESIDTQRAPSPTHHQPTSAHHSPIPFSEISGDKNVAISLPAPANLAPAVAPTASINSDTKEKDSSTVDLEEQELQHLTPEQKQIILDQVRLDDSSKVTWFSMLRFATKFELFLMFVGLWLAIAAGTLQPLMTVMFGSLTTAFTNFATVQIYGGDLDAARDVLFSKINKNAANLSFVGLGMFLAVYGYTAFYVYCSEMIARRIREAYLRAVLRQNIGFFDKLGSGEVATRITTNLDLIQVSLSDKVPIIVQFLSAFVSAFVIAYIINWRLALVLSGILPAIMLTGGLMTAFNIGRKARMLELTGEGGTMAEEALSSVRNVKAFGIRESLASLYSAKNTEIFAIGKGLAWINAWCMGTFFFIIYSAYALAFYYGTTLIIQSKASSGNVITCVMSVLIGAFSLALIAPEASAITSGIASAQKILHTIRRVPPIDPASDKGVKPKIYGQIELRNVDFYYPSRPSLQVLKNFTAIFPQGKMTALVGASGSGKSTIVGLLEQWYHAVNGEVLIDGVNIKDYNIKYLRNQMGLVQQEPVLFATSIYKNIADGLIGTEFEHAEESIKRKMVQQAAVEANADGFIQNLPNKYDELIGERAMLLSGGQRQRIAIARAIVRNPPILLLDEATAALDSTSERLVQDALDQVARARTVISIAHRLSTIRNAHNIIVMAEGRIVEQGNHTQLLEREGAYSKLIHAQKLREQAQQEDEPVKETVDPKYEQAEIVKTPVLEKSFTVVSESSAILKAQHDSESKQTTHRMTNLFVRYGKLNQEAKWNYAIGFFGALGTGMVYPVYGIVFATAVGDFALTDRGALRSAGNHNALLMFIVALVATVLFFVQSYFFEVAGYALSRILRVKTLRALLRQDTTYFDRAENSSGALTSLISDSPEKLQGIAGTTLGTILQSMSTLVGGAIIGLCFAPKVAAVAIALIPFTLSQGFVRLKVIGLKDEKMRKVHENSAQMACEAASAIRTVSSLTREEYCSKIFSDMLDPPSRYSKKVAFVSSAFYGLSQASMFWVIALIFWYGSRQLANGVYTSKEFYVALTAIIFGSIQAGNVMNFVPDVSKAKHAGSKLATLYDKKVLIDEDDEAGRQLSEVSGHVVFKNVHFRYPSREHVSVLRGVSFEVKPGTTVALCGFSGSGKSTIIQLVERYYDPLTGTIEIDGQNLRGINVASLRSQIGYVSQDTCLYDGTLEYNVKLGAHGKEVSQDQLEQACKEANIHDFIMSLPDGYKTHVGGKGSQLSGGQRQRVAIARALLRNPKILLLDEASSALDATSERVVQEALDRAAKNRSVLVVAHRLSTIQNADMIYVFEAGRIAESGTHNDLLAQRGIYFEMVQQQDLNH